MHRNIMIFNSPYRTSQILIDMYKVVGVIIDDVVSVLRPEIHLLIPGIEDILISIDHEEVIRKFFEEREGVEKNIPDTSNSFFTGC